MQLVPVLKLQDGRFWKVLKVPETTLSCQHYLSYDKTSVIVGREGMVAYHALFSVTALHSLRHLNSKQASVHRWMPISLVTVTCFTRISLISTQHNVSM